MEQKNNKKVLLLGVTFNTKNLGVKALTSSLIEGFGLQKNINEIHILDYNHFPEEYNFKIKKREFKVKLYNMRFSKKIFLKNNIVRLLMDAIYIKLLPDKFGKKILSNNYILNAIFTSDIIAPIAGGDSFSDIYGFGSLMYVTLPKLLCILLNKKIVLMPQTYGPFNKWISKIIAKYILKKSNNIYARDEISIKKFKDLVPNKKKIDFCYDVAFILHPKKMPDINYSILEKEKNNSKIIIGLNISGLLYIGGYNQKNMFKLSIEYKKFIYTLIEYILSKENICLLLVPHVFGADSHIESDFTVCKKIFNELKATCNDKLIFFNHDFNQNEIKYLIGYCDLFIGSRMHSCIAALSQEIPTIGLAYSRKFAGVFDSIGMKDTVIDLMNNDENQIITRINQIYDKKDNYKKKLSKSIPIAKAKILDMFKSVSKL